MEMYHENQVAGDYRSTWADDAVSPEHYVTLM